MDQIKSYLPVIIRYVLMASASALATRGWISPESQSILSQNLDILVGAILGLVTVAYALFIRPTAKALEVAKEVDKKVPPESPVVIKTPGKEPDIIVSGTPK